MRRWPDASDRFSVDYGVMAASLRSSISVHPTAAFFVLAFAMSWTLMAPAMIVGLDSLAAVPFFLGVWAPAAAAAIVVRTTGGSIRHWLRDILRWRVPRRYYLLALGFPIALAIVASAEFAVAGERLDFGLVGERAAAFLPLLLFCLLLNGGPEEPAWRGFALPRMQERLSPVKATVLLGTIWGLWHLPLLLVEDNVDHDLAALAFAGMLVWTLAGFTAYAFTYTYLWNRTHSALLCMLLHASYNTALGVVILRPADELVGDSYVAISLALTGTLWLVAIGLIVATRGRLGLQPGGRAAAPVATSERARRDQAPSRRPEPVA
jgi:membrane protease YdiL (CAAX protease family)